MSKYENRRQFHYRRETDRRARVVAEDEESCAEGPDFGQRESVHNCPHCVLANSEMKVLPAPALSLEISGASKRQGGLVRWPEISRTTKQPRDVLCEHVQHLSRCVPTGNSLRIGRKNREIMIPPG